MSWYYYSGRKPTPIPVGDGSGEVRSVKPHTKVEIQPSSENDVQIRTLSKMGVLRICGAPKTPQGNATVDGGPADVPPPKSGPGEPFKFSEFLTKEGDKRIGRPDPSESVAPVDRQTPDGDGEGSGKLEADAAADVQGEEGPKRRTRRRRKSSS